MQPTETPTNNTNTAVVEQPSAKTTMNTAVAPPDSTQTENETLRLRGGRDGPMCPGRFCYIIPIPCNCNFILIPLPCCC